MAIFLLFILLLLLTTCTSPAPASREGIRVLAVEPFLADLTQNVAGDRVQVSSLIPTGLDPHSFEPTPQDLARLNSADVVIQNGAGLEDWLQDLLENNPATQKIIIASAGLTPRTPQPGEPAHDGEGETHLVDPHFWLNPIHAIRYVENIRDGLIAVDPAGADLYTANTEAYIAHLHQLDEDLQAQISTIPVERRLLVTNHESFGYFADHYSLTIIGAIIPSVSTGATPSARELADLVQSIQASGAPAIFLETGANPQLADQLSAETGIRVVSDLYTHSLSGPEGPAASYLDMMRYNTRQIVEALR